MKNIGVKLLFVVLGFTIITACGETEEERRAKERARMDSLRQVQQQQIAEEMARLEEENTSDATDEDEATTEAMSENNMAYSFVENGEYAVQVGAFRSEDKAKGYIAKWSDRNYPSVYTVKIGEEEYGDVWFRVRVGFFGSKEEAAKLGAELAEEINSGYWVSKVR
ncbi:MAG TPA: SPOR domain-containing protein [Balneola sp.]|jgi:cell division septation protein DedD|nr:SPOR domain-containing protein [Bacteroidota bacterium]MAC04961.1 SPOR domain-containing protein [Balneola sp.]MAO76423.1 SPOR domain-containing protein [Balneola sp.]MBF65614.1 SPOR domain-containing protein [Balneola sp.]HAH50010.1 SPOR domain-containing protein [Balneola sp.]|tara:strand:- start:10218 stop:10715 length:498 start_codon:yes stop_codon:yes gene_type:complete